MVKTMVEITVKTDDGMIIIEQPDSQGIRDQILIMPEQLDLLIHWLRKAEKEVCIP